MAWTVRLIRRVEQRALRRIRQDFSCTTARLPGASPEAGVIAVDLLVVLGLFAIVVVRGAHRGAGALVGAVGQDEDLPREADLDDAVGTGRGQIGRASWQCAGEPQGCAIRRGNDLHVHDVFPMFLAVVRLIRPVRSVGIKVQSTIR